MITKLKNKIVKSFRSKKLNIFGLFFLLAFLFLIVTKLSKEYTELITLKVEYKNIPKEHTIISKNDSINVVVKGLGFNILPYYLFDYPLVIDFKNDVKLENDIYKWSAKNDFNSLSKTFKKSIEIISVNPDSLNFTFQSLTVKRVLVKSNVDIAFAFGYDATTAIKCIPDSIRIIGPKHLISDIKFVKTNSLKLSNVNKNINQNIELDFKSKSKGIYLSEQSVLIKADVEKYTEGSVEVPVSVTNLPIQANINIFPKTVTIVYNLSLNNYKKVKPSDFKVECDYSEISETKSPYLIPRLVKKSNLIRNARLTQSKIEYILTE